MTVPEGGCEEVNKGAETEHEPETRMFTENHSHLHKLKTVTGEKTYHLESRIILPHKVQ